MGSDRCVFRGTYRFRRSMPRSVDRHLGFVFLIQLLVFQNDIKFEITLCDKENGFWRVAVPVNESLHCSPSSKPPLRVHGCGRCTIVRTIRVSANKLFRLASRWIGIRKRLSSVDLKSELLNRFCCKNLIKNLSLKNNQSISNELKTNTNQRNQSNPRNGIGILSLEIGIIPPEVTKKDNR